MNFYQTPFELPIAFIEILKEAGSLREHFCFYYSLSKPVYEDGFSSFNFSYYAAYEPLIAFLTTTFQILKASQHFNVKLDFGTDDSSATHVFLIQRNLKIFIAEYDEAIQYLRQNNNPEIIKYVANKSNGSDSVEECRKSGIFEFLFGPHPDLRQNTQNFINDLESQCREI